MRMSDYACRKATHRDDIKNLAKYIHLTDPYIYPVLCPDPEDAAWCDFVGQCVKVRDNVFTIDHLSVVTCREEIVGVACVVPCGKTLTVTHGIRVPEALKLPLETVIAGYFAPLIQESAGFDGYNIVNVCVDPAHRGRGAGKCLMEHCVAQYGTQPLHLDVIADNTTAVRLYERWGFAVQNEYLGFSGTETLLPCYHMLRQPNN